MIFFKSLDLGRRGRRILFLECLGLEILLTSPKTVFKKKNKKTDYPVTKEIRRFSSEVLIQILAWCSSDTKSKSPLLHGDINKWLQHHQRLPIPNTTKLDTGILLQPFIQTQVHRNYYTIHPQPQGQ